MVIHCVITWFWMILGLFCAMVFLDLYAVDATMNRVSKMGSYLPFFHNVQTNARLCYDK